MENKNVLHPVKNSYFSLDYTVFPVVAPIYYGL